ncbi:hypothetical protein ACFFRR_002540 [Megaselia abdita]
MKDKFFIRFSLFLILFSEEPYYNGRSQTTLYKPNSPRSSLHHNQNQNNHPPQQQQPPHQYNNNNEQVPTNQNQSKPANNNNSTSSLTTTSSPATTTSSATTTILPSNSNSVVPPTTSSCVSLSPIIDSIHNLRNANHDSQRIRSYSASGHNIFNSKKRTTPLTPPPISSKREHIESTRTRSISLTANSQQQQIFLAGYNGILDNNHHHLNNQHQSTGNVVYNGNGGASLISSLQNGNYQIAGNGSRRRTTSTNSTGTRDQHNQSEKSRRAHLKTCFVNLKQQLELKDDEKKKTSNLAILQEAFRQVEDLKRLSQELEQRKEDLAKRKIANTTKISNLNRELISSGNSSIPERAVSESDAITINRPNGTSLIGYRYRTSSSGSVISSSSVSTTSSLSPNSLIAHSGGSPISASSSPPLNGLKLNAAPITANSNIPNGIKIPNNFNESKIHSLAAVAVEQTPLNLNASQLQQNSSTPTSTSIVAAMTNQSLPKDLSNGIKNGLTNQRKTSGPTLTVDSATKIVKVVNSKIATATGNGTTAATLQQQGYVVSPIYNNKNFKVIGSTIELSPNTTTTNVSAPNSAQLHKLLVTGGPQSQRNGLSATLSQSQNQSGNEIGRLPGGAELNYVSTGANNATLYRNGKFTFVNSKVDVANRGVHIISPNVATSIVVSQGQPIATNLTPIFSQPTQLAGKVRQM